MATDEAAGATPSPFLRFEALKKRSDFLQAAKGHKEVSKGFVLQAWNRHDSAPPRVGYTCSKRVGNAVARNHAKRRLREAARQMVPFAARTGWDYVLIGRAGATAAVKFDRLVEDLTRALERIHHGR